MIVLSVLSNCPAVYKIKVRAQEGLYKRIFHKSWRNAILNLRNGSRSRAVAEFHLVTRHDSQQNRLYTLCAALAFRPLRRAVRHYDSLWYMDVIFEPCVKLLKGTVDTQSILIENKTRPPKAGLADKYLRIENNPKLSSPLPEQSWKSEIPWWMS
ncbi:hypothetical protein TNCV_1694051 [Trichonephila clavipes]|nr:hypothetical protein TNCV_1694051 [Trichonephila clavipes]